MDEWHQDLLFFIADEWQPRKVFDFIFSEAANDSF